MAKSTKRRSTRTSDPHAPRATDATTSARTPIEDDKDVTMWMTRIRVENKVFEDWEKTYRCEQLWRYYRGRQWDGQTDQVANEKYTINVVFASLETQLPALLFNRPKVRVEGRPGRGDDDVASARASLAQSLLQTFVDDPKVHFKKQTKLALRDVYFRFGIIEVGYSGDYIDNPNADKPVLRPDSEDPVMDSDGTTPLTQPKRVLKDGGRERLYVRRVPPRTFRASPGRNILLENDWVGYYEWHQLDDVKANPEYEHTDGMRATGALDPTKDERDDAEESERVKRGQMVKLWKLWDLRAKKKFVLAEGHPKMLVNGKDFKFLPLSDGKFYELEDQFFPLPPVFNWISPQNEINEIRDMRRNHRRRFVRRYLREPSFKEPEFAKLETGEDGVCVEVPSVNPMPIAVVPDADLSPQNMQLDLSESKDDLATITGVSGEQRNEPDAPTATQANIVNVNAQVREGSLRLIVADWLADVCRLMLFSMVENMQLPVMAKLEADPFGPIAPDTIEKIGTWKAIKAEDVDGLDVDVKIDISSLSPQAEQQQLTQWMSFLQVWSNPAQQILLSQPDPVNAQAVPPFLRKTLTLFGITSEQEIRSFWRVAQALAAAQSQAAAAAHQQAPERMKISLALKGEDLSNPMVQAVFAREEMLQTDWNAKAPAMSADAGTGTPSPPAAPGAVAGTPAGVSPSVQ
jgi:hypothetical protein